MTGEAMRLDRWLWHARFFKSRGDASDHCASAGVRVDGTLVTKAHFQVRPGHVLTFARGGHVRVVRVVALGERRGPASEAMTLFEDLAPPEPETRLPRPDAASPGFRPTGSGRPTKRDRRRIDRLVR